MQYNEQLQQYLRRNVEGANAAELVLLLYDTAISAMTMGKARLESKDIEGTHNALLRALRVMEELISCLNMEKGGEIAKNLLSLYVYIRKRLTGANSAKEPSGIDEALFLMGGLRAAWKKALAANKAEAERAVHTGPDSPLQAADPASQGAPRPVNISV
jgi:flagellar protein FliS